MKRIFALTAALVLTGCATSSSGPTAGQKPHPGAAQANRRPEPAPRYEYQLEYEYSDAATPFLHLVEVRDP